MATSLFIISNIKTTKKEVLEQKAVYLQKLKDLNLEHTTAADYNENGKFRGFVKDDGDWEYKLPEMDDAEIICFKSPFVFSLNVYANCLEISTINKYSFLYSEYNIENDSYIWTFRKKVFDIISIFGGTEIIYLADNGCNKLSYYLECQIWNGESYKKVKEHMLTSKTPLVSNYRMLQSNKLSYSNIKEFVWDDFKDYL